MASIPGIPATACSHCEKRPLSFFCNLSPSPLADYNLIGSIETAPAGTILFREDDVGNRVLAICSGRVKLSCESRSGRILNLKLAMPGDVLGLSAVLSAARFETTAETIDATTLKSIPRDQFLGFLHRNAEGGVHAAQKLSEDYRLALHDARRLALSGSAIGRVAGILLDWGHAASCGKPEMRFIMAMSHNDLANFAGTSRETVTRTLGKLQDDKTIAIRGTTIHILSPNKLAELSV